MKNTNLARDTLFRKLSEVATKGPIPAISKGDTAVGMTLMNELGIEYSSLSKPNFHGIVVTAHRRTNSGRSNRVNLFAQVPDWTISECKSSREIVERYGYYAGHGKRRLYCTVSANHLNSQGLSLTIDDMKNHLIEVAQKGEKKTPVATWKVKKLQDRLIETHPESVWVKAITIEHDGKEFFHYRECIYSGAPKENVFRDLLETGTITIDHLITLENGRVIEKGPLFKIRPANLGLLFPSPQKYDLLSLDYQNPS